MHTYTIYSESPDIPVDALSHPSMERDEVVYISDAPSLLFDVWDKESLWLEAEKYFVMDHEIAYDYALVRGRWPEAEPIILMHPYWALNYATHVLKRRWLEAEPAICMDAELACHYANAVIGGRWLEAEPTIRDSIYRLWYEGHFKCVLHRL